MSRNRVLLRHLPKDLNAAPIYVSPEASLSHLKLRLESDLFNLAREFVNPGDAVWDIGANVGLFAIAAAQKAGPTGSILAIEPDLWLASLLQRSASAQRPDTAPIHIFPAAVSNAAGIGTFHIANRNRASNHLASVPEHSQAGGTREIDLLHGADRLLSEIRPILMCESQHRNRPAATTIFRRYNYKLYDWDANPRVEIETAAFNTLAIPA